MVVYPARSDKLVLVVVVAEHLETFGRSLLLCHCGSVRFYRALRCAVLCYTTLDWLESTRHASVWLAALMKPQSSMVPRAWLVSANAFVSPSES